VKKPGLMTGSGFPQRFADLDGTMIDVYQSMTQVTDEEEEVLPTTKQIHTLLDNALGPKQYWGALAKRRSTTDLSTDDDHQIGYQALPRGVPVITSDGTQIGTVHRVLDNAREHIFDGIVVKTDSGRRFVDAPEVARITLRQVTLTIDAAEAAKLPPYGGTIGALQTNARRTRARWWRRLFR